MGKGWLGALLIKNRLHKVQKKKKKTQSAPTRASLAAWGPGPLKGPVGSRGKTPGGGSGGEAPGSSCAFQ